MVHRGTVEPAFWVITSEADFIAKVRTVAWNCFTSHRSDKRGNPLVTLKWNPDPENRTARPEARAIMCVLQPNDPNAVPMDREKIVAALEAIGAVQPSQVVPE